ncbi:MAG: hypothetical protein IKB47_00995 [Clostridia bacterium]|nr:hypothetical protein [Clostridia bacterium]
MKRNRKRKKYSFKRCVLELSKPSVLLLLGGLPVIIVEALVLLARLLPDIQSSPGYVLSVYPPMFEYIMISLAILLGGAMFIDYIVKNNS